MMIAAETYTLVETLTTQYRMNFFIAGRNLAGITNEESLVRAVPSGNHLNWLVGHVVATRCLLLPSLHQQSVWSDQTLSLYRRGSSGAVDADYLPFDEVVRAFGETHERIVAGVQALSDEELAAPAPFSPGGGPETLGTLLMKSTIHEGYHLGQTAILRRVVGKEGAIK